MTNLGFLHALMRMIACMLIISLALATGISSAVHGRIGEMDVDLAYATFAFFVLRYDRDRIEQEDT